ncbi:M15 family metallopeptidase [Algibacter miyuki]|uniref:M15 family metallopeptidase n=1 Tax=Algibacter miyuki TaxID=1306933 RepID=A0ABV5GXX6_9FLAO|nr:M15 family metallopeptidase [Algibacter miyuki]MDN3667324.1 M15 family metallopeptidase [Algibacter miyuki]
MKKILGLTLFVFTFVLYACKDVKKQDVKTVLITETLPIKKPTSIIDSTITKDLVLGKFDYRKHELFQKVSPVHSSKTLYLNKSCYAAFVNMFEHAKADGIDLKIISGTRNFYEQKAIWERKWKKYSNLKPKARSLKILEYSSMPTSSRHHWGTDMDLNNLNNRYFETGTGLKIYNWLIKNAETYGFKQVYTAKTNGRTGYNMEKWHWSYMPLAENYLKFYNEHITYDDVSGFRGSEQASEVEIIKYYVNGIL